MPLNWRVRFGLCKRKRDYAFSHWAGCEQHLPSVLCSRLAYSRNTCRTVNLWGEVYECHPWAVSPQKTSCMPSGVPFPFFPSLFLRLQLPHFRKLPNEGTCHLYTSSVSCFSYPSSPPLLPLLCNFHLLCLIFPEPVHSDSAASSSGCCRGWQGEGRLVKHTDTCLDSGQDRHGGEKQEKKDRDRGREEGNKRRGGKWEELQRMKKGAIW